MALETGSYIDSLVTANPAATDALSQADDHLRLIKSTLKATFPNLTGAVTATQSDLNSGNPAILTDGSTPTLASGITADEVKALLGVIATALGTSTAEDGEVTPTLASGITAPEVRSLIGAADVATAATLLTAYPVGSIYTSALAANPSTLFGGTWISFGHGRVLVGNDDTASPDSDFVASSADGSTFLVGGSKTHTLSIDEIPSHTHSISNFEDPTGTGSTGSANGASSFSTVNTNATGGGNPHNIIQPYIVVYLWQRTA